MSLQEGWEKALKSDEQKIKRSKMNRQGKKERVVG
jgi:hypothetical protein